MSMTDPSSCPVFLEPMKRIGRFFFAWRNCVFTATLLGLLFGCPPVAFRGSQTADHWLNLLGFLVTLGGQGIRALVIGQTPIASGGSHKRVAADSLITFGLLRHVRNPLYLGNLLVVAGLAIIHNNPLVYLLLLPLTVFGYHAIVANEEAFLAHKFGQDYENYCRRVRRWLPKLRGLYLSLRETPINWRRVLLQEYGSLYLAVALPLLLMIYEQILRSGLKGTAELYFFATLLAVANVTWLGLRRWKLAQVVRHRRNTAGI